MTRVLAIDEGSTGVRALVFDRQSRLVGRAYEEVGASFPHEGWVEQDPQRIWRSTQRVIGEALAQAGVSPDSLAAVGVTNQRATTVVWERRSGRPVYPAIGWQDLRTADRVRELLADGVFTTTGASATKLAWILAHIENGRARAERGELCFGTIDSYIVRQLTGGAVHATDPSNASCTGLSSFVQDEWNGATLEHLGIPAQVMPAIVPSSGVLGHTTVSVLGTAVPIAGIAGDQQAAMFGELATQPGAAKITLGTAAILDVNTGPLPVISRHGAFPLVLWNAAGMRPYCLEGYVTTAGAAVQWLRDGLQIIRAPEDTAELAASVPDSGGVWAVPAFQGLGTPYMSAESRAVIGGLSRGSTRAHVARAILEGIAFRCREVLDALYEDVHLERPAVLRCDGGAASNDFLLQMLADALGRPLERPETVQASALGAAYLAGLGAGLWSELAELGATWRSGGIFEPHGDRSACEERYQLWRTRVAALSR